MPSASLKSEYSRARAPSGRAEILGEFLDAPRDSVGGKGRKKMGRRNQWPIPLKIASANFRVTRLTAYETCARRRGIYSIQ